MSKNLEPEPALEVLPEEGDEEEAAAAGRVGLPGGAEVGLGFLDIPASFCFRVIRGMAVL